MTFTVSGTPLTITAPSAAESLDGSAFGFWKNDSPVTSAALSTTECICCVAFSN
jgi:hypothetical protein